VLIEVSKHHDACLAVVQRGTVIKRVVRGNIGNADPVHGAGTILRRDVVEDVVIRSR
jgi:hypothetical protein